MEYISVKEAAAKWGVSERRVRSLCEKERIEGAVKCGDWVWTIPSGTPRPSDGRVLRHIQYRKLKTGSQDYSELEKLKGETTFSGLSLLQKQNIVREILAFDSKELSLQQIQEILELKIQDLDLKTHIEVLNCFNCLSLIPCTLSEANLKKVNDEVMHGLSLTGRPSELQFPDKMTDPAIETDMLIKQYRGKWSKLHPVARAAFLFGELLRIAPFPDGNQAVAFFFLENELIQSGFPPVFFGTENMDQLKATLASSSLRGNLQFLIEEIVTALKEYL